MGASSSTEQVPIEQRELERQAASVGALPLLQNAFSTMSVPLSNSIPLDSLQQCFRLKYDDISCEGTKVHQCFTGLLDQFSLSTADLLFVSRDGGVSWIEFVRGYLRCCGRMPASSLLLTLFRVIAFSADKADCPLKLRFEFDSVEDGGKMSGSILPGELGMVLWLCWIMSWTARSGRHFEGKDDGCLPVLNHLVASAVSTCAETTSDFDAWRTEVFGSEVELDAGKIQTWALRTVPNLADCFSQFIHSKISKAARLERNEMGTRSSSTKDLSPAKTCEPHLLTCGRAWGISLSQGSKVSEEVLRICSPCKVDMIEEDLLYWSSLHGKGLNRFWSSIEGYHGPLLVLISAYWSKGSETDANGRKWVVGALTQQGFENRDGFYGTGGHLFAIHPVFNVFSPTGKEKNFLYSHLHRVGKVYEPHPKPVGIGFGGTIGNERIFIDEEFARLTVRHHAGDKTYQPGPLVPNQGFSLVEASIIEVEVWGLGGKRVRDMQTSYKKREELFTEQRRKVDLKTFASWEDSPEKLMMDMVSDPNRVHREDR
ncbi:hypothetical protein Dimus_028080 [Dionaea muscipula]